MTIERIQRLVRDSDPVPGGRRPDGFPDRAALLDVIDERTNMSTPTISHRPPEAGTGVRKLIPVLVGATILVVALAAVLILSGDDAPDVASLDTSPEVAEAVIGAFLGGNGDLAVALIHPDNTTFGDISDPAVQAEVRGFAEYFAAIGTEYEVRCEELAEPVVKCAMSANNDLYRAVDQGPASRPSFTVGIRDGKMMVSPSVPPPAIPEIDSHFRLWSFLNYQADFAQSCAGFGFEFMGPACANFIHDHVDEWAAAWKADQG